MATDKSAKHAPSGADRGLLPQGKPSQVTVRTVITVLLTVLAIIGVLFLFWQLRQLIRWAVIAVFLAVALNPAVNWLQSRRLPRGLAILIVYLVLLLCIAGLAALVVPPLVSQVKGLGNYLIALYQEPGSFKQRLMEMAGQYGLAGYVDNITAQLSTLSGRFIAAAGPLLVVTKGIVSSVIAFISILLLTFFLLLDGQRFTEGSLRILASEQRPRARRILARSAQAVSGYITGNLAISLIAGIAAFIILAILGIPYAVVLALIVALLDLIPLVGATLGAAIVVIVGLFVAPIKGLALLIYFIIYQQIENNLLQPLVYGRSVKLHPLAVFLAVLAGGELLGILGALLAIPVAEIIRILIAEWLATRGVVEATADGETGSGDE